MNSLGEISLAIVTPSGLDAQSRAAHVAGAIDAAAPSRAVVILRDPGLAATNADAHVAALTIVCEARATALVIHHDLGRHAEMGIHLPDRPQLAAALPQRSGQWKTASSHAPEHAATLARVVDVVLLGPIWPTPGKPNALGPSALRFAKNAANGAAGRIFAIGGIDSPDRVSAAMEHGADGVAGIRAFGPTTIGALAAATRGAGVDQT